MSLLILPFLFPTLPFISLPLIFHISTILLISHFSPISLPLSFTTLPSFLFPTLPLISLPHYLSNLYHPSYFHLFPSSLFPLIFHTALPSFFFPTLPLISVPPYLSHLYHPSCFPLFPSSLFPLIFQTSSILLISHFPSSLFPLIFTPLPVANSVIILVSILCISINNILTLFIMTRPVHSGQVNFSLLINKLVPYQSFTCMDVKRALSFG